MFFFSSRRRHTRCGRDWSSDVCSSDLEDFIAEQFEIMQEELDKAGYVQYEISNFGKPDTFAIHNSNYWLGIPYLGIGPRSEERRVGKECRSQWSQYH